MARAGHTASGLAVQRERVALAMPNVSQVFVAPPAALYLQRYKLLQIVELVGMWDRREVGLLTDLLSCNLNTSGYIKFKYIAR